MRRVCSSARATTARAMTPRAPISADVTRSSAINAAIAPGCGTSTRRPRRSWRSALLQVEYLGYQLEGTDAVAVVVHDRGEHQLIRGGALLQLVEAAAHRVGAADNLVGLALAN